MFEGRLVFEKNDPIAIDVSREFVPLDVVPFEYGATVTENA